MIRSMEIPAAAVDAAAERMRDAGHSMLGCGSLQSTEDTARAALASAVPYLAPATDGGLREALEQKLATTDGWAVANETLLDLLRAHPAAPAVPQPAPVCSNCEATTFACTACGARLEEY